MKVKENTFKQNSGIEKGRRERERGGEWEREKTNGREIESSRGREEGGKGMGEGSYIVACLVYRWNFALVGFDNLARFIVLVLLP